MFRKLILASALSIAALAAQAGEATKLENLQATVAQINPNAEISWVKDSPIPGLNEVGVDGVVLYISDDGRYLLHGTLLDVIQRKNLTEIAGAETRKALLASIKDQDKIIFKPDGPAKHRILVFTDISCGYCHKVHENLQAYLDRGIQVEYVAFPRGGPESPVLAQMDAIWCAKDRLAAYTSAIEGRIPDSPKCDSPVRAQYDLGDKIGVQGTPAIYTLDGMQHGGYVPPEQLASELEANRKPGEPDAPEADETATGEAGPDDASNKRVAAKGTGKRLSGKG